MRPRKSSASAINAIAVAGSKAASEFSVAIGADCPRPPSNAIRLLRDRDVDIVSRHPRPPRAGKWNELDEKQNVKEAETEQRNARITERGGIGRPQCGRDRDDRGETNEELLELVSPGSAAERAEEDEENRPQDDIISAAVVAAQRMRAHIAPQFEAQSPATFTRARTSGDLRARRVIVVTVVAEQEGPHDDRGDNYAANEQRR